MITPGKSKCCTCLLSTKHVSREESVRRAEEMFRQLDKDGDKSDNDTMITMIMIGNGDVTEDEFVIGCMQDEVLVSRLSAESEKNDKN